MEINQGNDFGPMLSCEDSIKAKVVLKRVKFIAMMKPSGSGSVTCVSEFGMSGEEGEKERRIYSIRLVDQH